MRVGGYLEMGQKVIEGGMFLVKSYACDFEMAQLRVGSKSRSRVKTPRWLKIRKKTDFEVLDTRLEWFTAYLGNVFLTKLPGPIVPKRSRDRINP